MEKYICNACGIEKDRTFFHLCSKCTDGIIKICKTCKNRGLKSNKIKVKQHTFNTSYRIGEKGHFSLAGCGAPDYRQMYLLLTEMGYDVNKDVHQQFLDKHNPQIDIPMKYKKRQYNTDNFYLSDGTKNKKKPLPKSRGKG